MSSKEWRYVAAVFVGVFFHVMFFWKFEPYSSRERSPGLLPWYWLPVLALIAGFLLTLALEGRKRWIPVTILGAVCAANACLIVFDCASDPTNHNLWPFEFVIIGLAIAPAFLGAGISHLVERLRVTQA